MASLVHAHCAVDWHSKAMNNAINRANHHFSGWHSHFIVLSRSCCPRFTDIYRYHPETSYLTVFILWEWFRHVPWNAQPLLMMKHQSGAEQWDDHELAPNSRIEQCHNNLWIHDKCCARECIKIWDNFTSKVKPLQLNCQGLTTNQMTYPWLRTTLRHQDAICHCSAHTCKLALIPSAMFYLFSSNGCLFLRWAISQRSCLGVSEHQSPGITWVLQGKIDTEPTPLIW